MNQEQIIDVLARLALFADLDGPRLQAVAHTFAEASFPAGQRILRQGIAGSGFFVILEGEVSVHVDGTEVARLGRGEFFGETSLLLGEAPVADVVSTSTVLALQLAGSELRDVLLAYPEIMYRMLQAVSRRLERANRRG
jgi:CRP-like cAMP-binding protein